MHKTASKLIIEYLGSYKADKKYVQKTVPSVADDLYLLSGTISEKQNNVILAEDILKEFDITRQVWETGWLHSKRGFVEPHIDYGTRNILYLHKGIGRLGIVKTRTEEISLSLTAGCVVQFNPSLLHWWVSSSNCKMFLITLLNSN